MTLEAQIAEARAENLATVTKMQEGSPNLPEPFSTTVCWMCETGEVTPERSTMHGYLESRYERYGHLSVWDGYHTWYRCYNPDDYEGT